MQAYRSRFFDLSNDLMTILGPDSLILDFNPSWNSLGWSDTDLRQQKLSDLLHKEDCERVSQALSDVASGRRDVAVLDARMLLKSGEIVLYNWKFQRQDSSEKIIGIGCEKRDFQDFAMREVSGRQFIKKLIDQLPVAIFCKDSWNNFNLVLWNKTCERWWGISEQQVLGKNDYEFFPKEQADSYRLVDVRTLESNSLVDVAEEETFHIEKGTIKCHTLRVPVSDAGRPRYMLAIAEDITDRLRTAKELEDQKALAINSSKMATLGQMAGGIAHEINNPLGVIILRAYQALRLLQMEKPQLDQVATFLKQIETTGQSIASIVNGLRSFARSGDGDPLAPVSLKAIVDDTLALCSAGMESHGIKIEILGLQDDLTIFCRGVQISQVLLNLLQNARDVLKTLDEGRERLVRIKCTQTDEFTFIGVQDSGPGIPKDLREKIMQPFFTTKAVGEGTGLGLSISKGIVESHKGAFYLDDKEALTTFVLKIPKESPQTSI